MKRILPFAAAGAMLMAHGLAQAEPFVFLDKFNELRSIDNSIWMENEITRVVLNKSLYFGLGVAGGVESDLGNRVSAQSLTVANSLPVTQIAADVTVDYIDVPYACGDSKFVAFSRWAMGGGFFNVGTSTPKNAVGDIVGRIVISRLGNSVDAPGVMNVTGEVLQCKNSNCLISTTLGSVVLGQATQGLPVGRLSIWWDAATSNFVFQQKANGPKLTVHYAGAIGGDAGKPEKTFSVRNSVPNCAGSFPPLVTKLTSKIDNVAVNESGAPF